MRRALLSAAVAIAALTVVVGVGWAMLPDPRAVATRNPRTTAVVEQRRAEAAAARRPFHPSQVWVPLGAIAPRLAQAVVVSEDAGFYAHGPFDTREMWAAVEEHFRENRPLRGASTLTQQLARTLWLGTQRSAWRKLKEAVLAVKVERALPKRRILALYLNSVEWGPGVFGAEAAARHWFGVPAAAVDTAQAVVLASMLPAPRRADVRNPPRWLAARSRRLLDRMLAAGRIGAAEHAHASAELERILAGASGPEEPPADDDAPDAS